MRIAIVGAGALGLYYGALLQRSGMDVHFLLRRDYDAITQSGLWVFSVNGDFYLQSVKGFRRPEEIGPVDLVLVGLKTFANESLASLIKPLTGGSTAILTLQNGLGNEEALATAFGSKRILGGVAFLCSNRGVPGEVHHVGAGRIVMGEFEKHDRARLDRLVSIFTNAGVECRATDDLRRSRWEKLVWNIPYNGLCALLLQPVNLLQQNVRSRQMVRELMLEVIAAANSQALTKPIADDFSDRMLEFTDTMGEYKPSMHIDREEGRQLEIDSIFRTPLSYAHTQGVKMPRVEMLTTLLEQITGSTTGL